MALAFFVSARTLPERVISKQVQTSRQTPSSGKPFSQKSVPSSYRLRLQESNYHQEIVATPAFPAQIDTMVRIGCTKPNTLLSFLWRMYILFAISILCLFALAAVAITWHVRTGWISAGPQRDFAHHLFAAAADQKSRTPSLTSPRNPILSSKRF